MVRADFQRDFTYADKLLDLADGGAEHFASTIRKIKHK
jgi:lipoate synthase